ncbi:hypothetical protein P0F02_002654 [Vibrio metschnikovii]|nr:hypothetical protein [Vibrio metschnikovii]
MNPKTPDYQKQQRYQENEILEHAAEILATRYVRGDALANPDATKGYMRYSVLYIPLPLMLVELWGTGNSSADSGAALSTK